VSRQSRHFTASGTSIAPISFEAWELEHLRRVIAAETLNYMGHYAQGHLRPEEVDKMNRLNALSYKLEGRKSPSVYPNDYRDLKE
jgi:hypothetical protein